jgi:hypothetical protein
MKYKFYSSDDYIGCKSKTYSFYYGYEKTFCKKHGKDSNCECPSKEDCFVAEKKGKEILRVTSSQLGKKNNSDSLYYDIPYPAGELLLGILLTLETLQEK